MAAAVKGERYTTKRESESVCGAAMACQYLRQTRAMTTTTTMKTNPAMVEPTIRGSCS